MLYADDTSLIITNPSPIEFANKLNVVFANVNEWFRNNLLFLNFNKTTYLHFRTKDSQKLDLSITLQNNQITDNKHKISRPNYWRDIIMEMSHELHIIKAKLGMLCNQGYYTSHVRGYFKNDLLFIYTFDNDIRYNFLGKLTT